MRRIRAVSDFLLAGMKLHRAQIQAITLGITIFFINSLQNLIIPSLEIAAHEFGYNELEKDQKLGANLAFAYFIIRIPVSVMCGCTMDFDFINRVRLLQVASFIAAVSCLSTYSAATYKQLLTCRFFTGLGVSAATSVTFSILFDLFERHREIVNTAVFLSMTAGIAFGNLIAGAIEYHSHWRSPFLIGSIPVFLCLLALQFLVHDPARGTVRT
jgi:MFS family permease